MGNTDAEKSIKVRRTYRMEETLLKDLKQIERLTGKDFTATLHEAVRRYKQSAEFKSDVERYQRELADEAAAEFTGRKASKTDTESTILDTVSAKATRGKSPRSRSK